MSNKHEQGGRAAPSRAHLTRRPGNKPGEQPEAVRDHNDTVPSTTEPTCGPLVCADLPKLRDEAEKFLADQYDDRLEQATDAFRLWADVSNLFLVDTDETDFGQFQDEWPGTYANQADADAPYACDPGWFTANYELHEHDGQLIALGRTASVEAAAFLADQYAPDKQRAARTAFALWSDLKGWNPLTASEEDCFAFLDEWPGTYGSDEAAHAAYADNSDDDPSFDPRYFDDNYEVHELNGQFIVLQRANELPLSQEERDDKETGRLALKRHEQDMAIHSRQMDRNREAAERRFRR